VSKKTITINLNQPQSIKDAIKALEDQKAKLDERLANRIRSLIEWGKQRELEYLGMFVSDKTGVLRESIATDFKEEIMTGYIQVGDADPNVKAQKAGFFVEFGTGIKGAQDPHPTGKGEYDQKQWVYFDPDLEEFFTTTGQASKPFVYYTYMELLKKIARGDF